jgi:ABC-2 type transport system permease protein
MISKALAFLRRDLQTQASYRLNFVMRVAGLVVSITTYYFISQIFGTAISRDLLEYTTDYFHFALIGIAFYPFVRISANSMAEAIGDYQSTGTLEVLFLTPTPILGTLVMSTLWKYSWAVAETLFFLLISTLFFRVHLNWYSLVLALPILLLVILANAGLGLLNAGFVLVTKRPSPLVPLLALLTNLLAGVYFPAQLLPGWLQVFSRLLPATYSFDALRRTILMGASLLEVGHYLLALAGFAVVLLPVGLVALRLAVRWAKIDGSLSQY